MDIKETELKLKKPFKPDELEFRISATTKDKTKGLAVAYIQNRAVQNRLDEVVGFNNWKNEFIELKNGSKICGISIKINNEWITKYDGASDTDIESTKGGLSNSMKRAAVQWGIGRYLYNLPGQWVRIQPKGKSYEIIERPTLPNWALPLEFQKEKSFKFEPCEKYENKLPEFVQVCINAFKKINISQAELETYLALEAETFTDKDIDTLRNVYSCIASGKNKKEDFFRPLEKPKRGQQTLKLEEYLGE